MNMAVYSLIRCSCGAHQLLEPSPGARDLRTTLAVDNELHTPAMCGCLVLPKLQIFSVRQ